MLASVRELLEKQHPVFVKIDLDTGDMEEVLAPENAPRWGFWLKHHCRCIYGQDLANRFELFRPSRHIAVAVNGDFAQVLEDYTYRIDQEKDTSVRRRLQKEASRKLIRATNTLRRDDEKSWPISLDDHMAQFVATFPEKAFALHYFYRYATDMKTLPDAALFTVNLRVFSAWMQAQQQAVT